MSEIPHKFVDLPRKAYPFTIEAFDHDDAVIWSETVKEPCALEVPGFHGGVKFVRVTFADGNVEESDDGRLFD